MARSGRRAEVYETGALRLEVASAGGRGVDLLVLERGWTEAEYDAGLADSLVRELLGSP